MLNSYRFIDSQRNYIRKVRMPTGGYAMRHNLHNIFLLLGIKESDKLVHRQISKLVDISNFGSRYSHQIIDTLGYIIYIIDIYLTIQHTCTDKRLNFMLVLQHSLKIISRKSLFIDNLPGTSRTISAIECHETVKFKSEILYPNRMPACSQKHFYPLPAKIFYRSDS